MINQAVLQSEFYGLNPDRMYNLVEDHVNNPQSEMGGISRLACVA